jgi:hypothetical protein
MLLLLKDLLAKIIITCTLKDKLTMWLCLVEGYLESIHNLVSFKIEHTICSRMRGITKENIIDQPSLKHIQLLSFLQNNALATKDMEVTHLGCATMHQLVAGFLLMHRLNPEPPQSPMLIKRHPSHLTQGPVFPFHNTIMGRRIRTRKLVFKTQVMAKGFKMRVPEF